VRRFRDAPLDMGARARFSPLTPALSPLRGEGADGAARASYNKLRCALSVACRPHAPPRFVLDEDPAGP